MTIDKIVLNNFGSYENENVFDTKIVDDKNIIIVGGKNGAGKTTLFTAMRLCLYGYMSMGYKNINVYYNRAINRLINNNAKMKKPTNASVEMHISLSNGQELDHYILTRKWVLTESLTESFDVKKNGEVMDEQSVADFEKYILSLIPPELFNLYFFDGEKIADFFLNEGSNTRIKNAFLTLCGYDTFDIMRKNFKRVATNSEQSIESLNEYLAAKENVKVSRELYSSKSAQLDSTNISINMCEADLTTLDKNYAKNGGISQEEWDKKFEILKQEEKKREEYYSTLKKWANDLVPFLMIRNKIVELKDQINNENKLSKYDNFCEIINSENITNLINSNELLTSILDAANKEFGCNEKRILDLSFEQSTTVMGEIKNILDFDSSNIEDYNKLIKKSLRKSERIRKELENSNVSNVKEYMQKKAELLEEKNTLLANVNELEKELIDLQSALEMSEQELEKSQAVLTDELKQASINDIAAKSILMLDNLQKVLYKKQINKVEQLFRKEIKTLMRKTDFIDDILIDDDFNIHIYRSEFIESNKLIDLIDTNNEDQLKSILGCQAVKELMKATKSNNLDFVKTYFKTNNEGITLPIEIDKSGLSNGEKQIFIMALYHSLVQLCKYEIPFIIDTPFARIDTEHRNNISKYFFSKLKGQIFILSTNEEIDEEHIQIMKNKILATYMLENTDNKRTIIHQNTYFER